MTKTHFRILVVAEFFLVMMSGIIDSIFPNEVVALLTEYADTLESDWSETQTILIGGYLLSCIVYYLYTFLGLFLFWNSTRLIYLLGFFVFIPVYFFIGVDVASATGRVLFGATDVLAGFILALIYFSPVKSYFMEKSPPAISPTTDTVS